MNPLIRHQYIDRETGEVKTESLFCDRLVNYLYSRVTEQNKTLWQPSLIVFLQLFWIAVFLYTGKSQVTGSQISFHVIRDRI